MNKYCVDLNFNFPVFKNTFDFTKYKGIRHSSLDTSIFKEEFINLVTGLELKITWVEIFYVEPRDTKDFAIHTDNTGGDYVKMNWVFGGKNSLMQWYTVKPGVVKEPSKTIVNSLYMSYTKFEVELAHLQSVKFPSIAQVGIPHNIYNPKEDRYCLSIMLRDKDNNRLTMDTITNVFREYI